MAYKGSELIPILIPEAAREIERAEYLASENMFTEACLRLGRAVESSLYAVGREFNLDLTNREVSELKCARNEIDSAQAQILRNPSSAPSSALFDKLITMVERARSKICESEEARRGELSSQPKGNQRLFKDIGSELSDPVLRFRFKSLDPVAQSVQSRRNQAAHADQGGAMRELDEATYEELSGAAAELIDAVASAMLGERARRALASSR